MNSTLILVICAILLVLVGCWLGYSSDENQKAREMLSEKEEAELLAKARQEEAGRERNRKEVQKREVLEILNEAVSDPQRLRGLTSGWPPINYDHPGLRRFIERLNHVELRGEEVMQLKQQASKQANLIRDLQGQLKEISKALQLGQPVE